METRKSLAIALAVSGLAGQAAQAEPGTWAGPYIGVSAGGGTGAQSQNGGLLLLPLPAGATTGTSIGPTSAPTSTYYSDGGYGMSGALLGGGVGYNWQQERFVFGLEGDGSWSSISGSGTCGYYSSAPHACGGRDRRARHSARTRRIRPWKCDRVFRQRPRLRLRRSRDRRRSRLGLSPRGFGKSDDRGLDRRRRLRGDDHAALVGQGRISACRSRRSRHIHGAPAECGARVDACGSVPARRELSLRCRAAAAAGDERQICPA